MEFPSWKFHHEITKFKSSSLSHSDLITGGSKLYYIELSERGFIHVMAYVRNPYDTVVTVSVARH